MGAANYVVASMLKSGEKEETLVLERELFILVAAAENQQLFTLRKRTNCDGPLFDCDWHLQISSKIVVFSPDGHKTTEFAAVSVANYSANLKFPC